jgi:hypothetical protein
MIRLWLLQISSAPCAVNNDLNVKSALNDVHALHDMQCAIFTTSRLSGTRDGDEEEN